MIIHHANEVAAKDHLSASGFREFKPADWISNDRTCRATLHPHPSGKWAICYHDLAA